MDRIIEGFAAVADRDLMLCPDHGAAYQRDMGTLVPYDAAYFDKYVGYEGQDVAIKINEGRVAIVDRHCFAGSKVCDIGIGSGEFIRSRPNTFGHDVNPKAIDWLKSQGLWAAALGAFNAFTFWDVIEHVPEPDSYFRHVPAGGYLFTSLPIFKYLHRIRESRHYRPNEHLYYWTQAGFVAWMALNRFRLLERQNFEIAAGRDSIWSFAFRRDLDG